MDFAEYTKRAEGSKRAEQRRHRSQLGSDNRAETRPDNSTRSK